MSILQEDINTIASSDMISWWKLSDSTILVTGGTGLIGQLIVKSLFLRNEKYKSNIKIILPVRNMKKAMKLYGKECLNMLVLKEISLEKLSQDMIPADYVIHCAAPTQSSFFVENPVETIQTIVEGTFSVLEYAKKYGCKGVVAVSSMEVFGQNTLKVVAEDDLGLISLSSVRSSYPEAKRLMELLCFSYYKEYELPITVVRLAQTFGPGVALNDNRVFMQFCKAILNDEDIIMHTTGETVINYCYTVDAVLGILKVMLDGKWGETYNLVNSDSAITIFEIAQWLLQEYGKESQKICLKLQEGSKYAVQNTSKLSNKKVHEIGWYPAYTVQQGYQRLLQYLGEN